jgi:ATP-dependent exoDNAse (exonuclease V) beta subunit
MRVGMPVRQRAVPPERPWWSPEGGRLSPRERGKQVHRLLSQLPDRAAWPGVRTVLEADAGLGATDVRNLVADVERVLALPSLAPFFEPGSEVHTERAFAGSEGQIFIPDRLIRTPTGWAVLDFKTGKPRPSDEAQVAGYMRQIAQIETGEVTGWICYLESGTCMAVQAQLF